MEILDRLFKEKFKLELYSCITLKVIQPLSHYRSFAERGQRFNQVALLQASFQLYSLDILFEVEWSL